MMKRIKLLSMIICLLFVFCKNIHSSTYSGSYSFNYNNNGSRYLRVQCLQDYAVVITSAGYTADGRDNHSYFTASNLQRLIDDPGRGYGSWGYGTSGGYSYYHWDLGTLGSTDGWSTWNYEDYTTNTYGHVVYTCVSPNSAPTNISLSSTSIDENSVSNTTVGTLSTTDAEGGSFTYTLVGGDTGNFNISGSNLRANVSTFDYETDQSDSVTIRTTDNGGLTKDVTFTISINDILEYTDDHDGDGVYGFVDENDENASNRNIVLETKSINNVSVSSFSFATNGVDCDFYNESATTQINSGITLSVDTDCTFPPITANNGTVLVPSGTELKTPEITGGTVTLSGGDIYIDELASTTTQTGGNVYKYSDDYSAYTISNTFNQTGGTFHLSIQDASTYESIDLSSATSVSFDGSLIITMDIDNPAPGTAFPLITGDYVGTDTWSTSLTLPALVDNIEWDERGLFVDANGYLRVKYIGLTLFGGGE
jgi:hypothetical protein